MEENFFRNNITPNNPVRFDNNIQNQLEMQILDENLKSNIKIKTSHFLQIIQNQIFHVKIEKIS